MKRNATRWSGPYCGVRSIFDQPISPRPHATAQMRNWNWRSGGTFSPGRVARVNSTERWCAVEFFAFSFTSICSSGESVAPTEPSMSLTHPRAPVLR